MQSFKGLGDERLRWENAIDYWGETISQQLLLGKDNLNEWNEWYTCQVKVLN